MHHATLGYLVLNYFARFFVEVGVNYEASSLYFFGNILDLIVSIERLRIFLVWLRKFTRNNPYFICILTFLACHTINLPNFFRFYVKSDPEVLHELEMTYKNRSIAFVAYEIGVLIVISN